MEKNRIKETTIEVILYKYYTAEGGRHPVRVKITHNRKTKYFPVQDQGQNIFLTTEQWQKLQANKTEKELRKIKSEAEAAKVRAMDALRKTLQANKPFSFERFTKEFLTQESDRGFLALFFDHLQSLLGENRIGTYNSYTNAYNAFKDFRKEHDLSPFDITVQVLKSFEAFLQKRGCGKTTIAIYMRAVKVIYNLAADSNPALLENYPFARKQTDRNRYKIKTGSGHKGEALSIEQLQKFIAIKTDPYRPEHEAKLIWLFSFYCQGMNVKDIALLKYKDIRGDVIRYVRSKTKDTEAKEAVMEIVLTDQIRAIIRELGNSDKKPNSYVFLIIPNGLASTVKRRTEKTKTADERIGEIIKQKIKTINTKLKQICKDSEDDDLKVVDLTTYWARHTYASLLKESGESVEMIRELLGHGDIKTTENYLKRFDLTKRQAVNERIQSLLKVS